MSRSNSKFYTFMELSVSTAKMSSVSLVSDINVYFAIITIYALNVKHK